MELRSSLCLNLRSALRCNVSFIHVSLHQIDTAFIIIKENRNVVITQYPHYINHRQQPFLKKKHPFQINERCDAVSYLQQTKYDGGVETVTNNSNVNTNCTMGRILIELRCFSYGALTLILKVDFTRACASDKQVITGLI